MPPQASYDLMVLLDPEAAEDARTGVLERVKSQIESGDATLKGDSDWGMRRLAYEIDHRGEAQYHLFQFQASAEVLNELGRTLSIDDIVLRFRTIRLPGEAPEVTPPAPSHVAPEPRRRDDRGRRDGSDRGRDSGDRPRETAPPPDAAPAEATPADAVPAETAPPAEAAPAEATPAVATPAEAAPAEAAPAVADADPEPAGAGDEPGKPADGGDAGDEPTAA